MAAASDPGSVLCVAGGIVRIAVHDGPGGATRRNVDPLIGVASGEHERRNRQDDRDPHSHSSSPEGRRSISNEAPDSPRSLPLGATPRPLETSCLPSRPWSRHQRVSVGPWRGAERACVKLFLSDHCRADATRDSVCCARRTSSLLPRPGEGTSDGPIPQRRPAKASVLRLQAVVLHISRVCARVIVLRSEGARTAEEASRAQRQDAKG